ncbi:unnamed protein product [Caretta caretta]
MRISSAHAQQGRETAVPFRLSSPTKGRQAPPSPDDHRVARMLNRILWKAHLAYERHFVSRAQVWPKDFGDCQQDTQPHIRKPGFLRYTFSSDEGRRQRLHLNTDPVGWDERWDPSLARNIIPSL